MAFVAFAPYDYDASLLDVAAARALIERAASEASVVVVYMHAGAEGADADQVTGREEYYLGEDRGDAEAFAHLAIDAGASLHRPARRGFWPVRGPHPAVRRRPGTVTSVQICGSPGRAAAGPVWHQAVWASAQARSSTPVMTSGGCAPEMPYRRSMTNNGTPFTPRA